MYEKGIIEKIILFWFGKLDKSGIPSKEKQIMWWSKDHKLDEFIKENYEKYVNLAVLGELGEWKEDPLGMLAFIIVLDQFSRNIYRDTLKAFTQDELALESAKEGIEKGFDKKLLPIERIFFYLPFMHSENLEDQQECIRIYRELADECSSNPDIYSIINNSYEFAIKHFDIIKKYGRYPHRNSIMGRKSTAQEIEFLKQEGSSF